eukprot:3902517-Prymnesium_polylepis.1
MSPPARRAQVLHCFRALMNSEEGMGAVLGTGARPQTTARGSASSDEAGDMTPRDCRAQSFTSERDSVAFTPRGNE